MHSILAHYDYDLPETTIKNPIGGLALIVKRGVD
jgi:hypothetical protein